MRIHDWERKKKKEKTTRDSTVCLSWHYLTFWCINSLRSKSTICIPVTCISIHGSGPSSLGYGIQSLQPISRNHGIECMSSVKKQWGIHGKEGVLCGMGFSCRAIPWWALIIAKDEWEEAKCNSCLEWALPPLELGWGGVGCSTTSVCLSGQKVFRSKRCNLSCLCPQTIIAMGYSVPGEAPIRSACSRAGCFFLHWSMCIFLKKLPLLTSAVVS